MVALPRCQRHPPDVSKKTCTYSDAPAIQRGLKRSDPRWVYLPRLKREGLRRLRGLAERGTNGGDDLVEIVGLTNDLDGFGLPHELVEGGLVCRREHETALLHGLCTPHQFQEVPVRVIGQGDVVDDHGGAVGLDE